MVKAIPNAARTINLKLSKAIKLNPSDVMRAYGGMLRARTFRDMKFFEFIQYLPILYAEADVESRVVFLAEALQVMDEVRTIVVNHQSNKNFEPYISREGRRGIDMEKVNQAMFFVIGIAGNKERLFNAAKVPTERHLIEQISAPKDALCTALAGMTLK